MHFQKSTASMYYYCIFWRILVHRGSTFSYNTHHWPQVFYAMRPVLFESNTASHEGIFFTKTLSFCYKAMLHVLKEMPHHSPQIIPKCQFPGTFLLEYVKPRQECVCMYPRFQDLHRTLWVNLGSQKFRNWKTESWGEILGQKLKNWETEKLENWKTKSWGEILRQDSSAWTSQHIVCQAWSHIARKLLNEKLWSKFDIPGPIRQASIRIQMAIMWINRKTKNKELEQNQKTKLLRECLVLTQQMFFWVLKWKHQKTCFEWIWSIKINQDLIKPKILKLFGSSTF
jgi:hypothetical protein